MTNLYDIIINNPELIKLSTDIHEHLAEQFGDDEDKKALTLIATMGHGFNTVFSTLPNIIITSHILNEQLAKINAEGHAVEVANSMIEFVKDFTSKIDNDMIQDMTNKLAILSAEVKIDDEGNINESTVNSESN